MKYPWSHIVISLILHPVAVVLVGGAMFYIGREWHTVEAKLGGDWWRYKWGWKQVDWVGLWPVPICAALQLCLVWKGWIIFSIM